MGREFFCPVTIVFVFSLIVCVVNGTKAPCPCATEQQCQVIKDDKRKEVHVVGKLFKCTCDQLDRSHDMIGVSISCNMCNTFECLVYMYFSKIY